MKKLNAKVRVTEVDAVSDALVRLYKADKAVEQDAFLKGVMTQMETLSAEITAAIRQDKAVSDLEDADTERDAAVRDLGKLIDGYTAIPIPAMKEAAGRLKAVFAKYGTAITHESYAAESSLIESLLDDLGAADLKDSVAALEGVAESVSQLRAAQDAFIKASDEYHAAASVKSESATSLKKPLLEVINEKFVPYMTAMELSNAAVYGSFAACAAEEIALMNETVARRAK